MNHNRKKITIVVNVDGSEAGSSRKTANDMAKAIENRYSIDFLELSNENWLQKTIELPYESNRFCLLATHGGFGEDGRLQRILELKNISFSHSRSVACSIMCNKHLTKLVYLSLGINTPQWRYGNKAYPLNEQIYLKPRQFLEKPIAGGSKIGIHIIKQLPRTHSNSMIYEKIIPGNKEVSIGVLGNSDKLFALYPIIRVRDVANIGKLEKTKVTIDKKVTKLCQEWAKTVHLSLECRGVTKTDFLIDENNQVWGIETDAIPGLSENNAVAIAAKRSNVPYKNLVNMLITETYAN